MFETSSYLSHLKSLFIFLFSSQTCIIIFVPGIYADPLGGKALNYPEAEETDPWLFYAFAAWLLKTVKLGIKA